MHMPVYGMNMLTQNVQYHQDSKYRTFYSRSTTRVPYGPSHKFLWSKILPKQNEMENQEFKINLSRADKFKAA